MNFLKTYYATFAGFFIVWLFIAFVKLDANVFNWEECDRFILVLLGSMYAVAYAAMFGFGRKDEK